MNVMSRQNKKLSVPFNKPNFLCSVLGYGDWHLQIVILLCQLLPVRLCQDGAPEGDLRDGGREKELVPICFLYLCGQHLNTSCLLPLSDEVTSCFC